MYENYLEYQTFLQKVIIINNVIMIIKVITLILIRRRDCMTEKGARLVPDTKPVTDFLRGQSSKIFDDVREKDNTTIVYKNSKPQVAIISYERYKKLKEEGADI